MKKILLITNRVFHYRSSIYNAFFTEFEKYDYELHVLSNSFQEVEFEIQFVKHELRFGVLSYLKKINELQPEIVINFLHLKDLVLFPLTFYCRLTNIPVIYWNHGVDNQNSRSIKNIFYKLLHNLSSAIILYTPNELKYISKKNRAKTFIAFNTLDFSSVDLLNMKDRKRIKEKYLIKEDFVVLYISRILPYKKLDVLLEALADNKDVGLVIVGSGISDKQKAIVEAKSNYYYLGAKYGVEADELYNMGDVFSTPGHIGLALNQAFYWRKPVVVLKGRHAPEIYYMQNGKTGFIVESEIELKEKIELLSIDKLLLEKLSNNSKKMYETEMTLDKMFSGFNNAVQYLEKNRLR